MMRVQTNPFKLMDAVLADFERSARKSETDVFETSDAVLVKVNLPGVRPEQIELSLERNVLTLSAKLDETQPEGAKVLWRERTSGDFKRLVQIPVRIAHDGIEANLEQGVLTVRIPKAEDAQPKRIAINSIQS